MKTFKYIVIEENLYKEEEYEVNKLFDEEYLDSMELTQYLDYRERVNDINNEYQRCL